MEFGVESNLFVLRLNDGEELLRTLEDIATSENIESAVVLSGIGMLRDFSLGYYVGDGYKKTEFSKPHELVSLQGSLAKCQGEMIVHLHSALAGIDHESKAGHLFGGTVNGLAEVTMLKFTSIKLYRELNEKTGLKELHIK